MLKKVLGGSLTTVVILIMSCFILYDIVLAQKNKTPPEVAVDTVLVHYQQIPDYVSAPGTLIAVKSTDLSFLSDGHLAQKLFHNGDQVKKNDVVATLSNGTIAAALASAKANLDEAESNYKRYELLKDSGVFSKQDYNTVSTTLKVSKANYASVLEQKQQLSLSAPFAGTLGKYKFSVGAQIKAGDPVISLVQLDPLKVSYSLSQTEKGKVKTGQQVLIYSETWPGEIFEGKVVYISPTINSDTGQFDIEALLQNSQHKLSPGALVRVKHILSEGHKALVVPQKSVIVDQNRSYVYVIRRMKAYQQNVSTGKPTDNGNIIIPDGLKETDKVVVSGIQKLSEGTAVKIISHSEILKNIPAFPATTKIKSVDNDKKSIGSVVKEKQNKQPASSAKHSNDKSKGDKQPPVTVNKSEDSSNLTAKKENISDNEEHDKADKKTEEKHHFNVNSRREKSSTDPKIPISIKGKQEALNHQK